MGRTEAQARATNKYNKNTYDAITVKYKKSEDMPDRLKEHCIKYGYLIETGPKTGDPNKAEFIKKAIETQIAIDNGTLKVVKE